MATIADLDYTDNMAANKRPFLTDIRETLDSIETYVNDKIKDNLVQLTGDAFPSGYAFSNDAVEKFANSDLYDKLTSKNKYTGGDITISTTGAWLDVDTSNAKLGITPDYLTGDFKISAQFNVESVSSNSTNETDVLFRLTDGASVSDAIAKVKLITGVSGTTNVVPVSLLEEFRNLTGDALATIKLQYFIVTSTNTTIKVLANTNAPIALQGEKI